MKPKMPKETPDQIARRQQAERDNVASIQEYLQGQTRQYQRLRSPRVSIATGRSANRAPLS